MSKKYAREGLRRDRNLTDVPDSYTSLSHLLDDLAIPGQTFTPDDLYVINRISKGFIDNASFLGLQDSAFKATQIKYITDVILSVASEDDWGNLFEGYFLEATSITGEKAFFKVETIQNKRIENADDPNTRYLADVKLSSDTETFAFTASDTFTILGSSYRFEEIAATVKTQSIATLEPNITISDQINYTEEYTGKTFLNGGNGLRAKFYAARYLSENITESTPTENLVQSSSKFFGPNLFYDDGTFIFDQRLYDNDLFDDNGGLIQWEGYFANELLSPFNSFKISTNGYYRIEYSSDDGETWTIAGQSVSDTTTVSRRYSKYVYNNKYQEYIDIRIIEDNIDENGNWTGSEQLKQEIQNRKKPVSRPFEHVMLAPNLLSSDPEKIVLSKEDFVNIPEGGALIERADMKNIYQTFSASGPSPDPDFRIDANTEIWWANNTTDGSYYINVNKQTLNTKVEIDDTEYFVFDDNIQLENELFNWYTQYSDKVAVRDYIIANDVEFGTGSNTYSYDNGWKYNDETFNTYLEWVNHMENNFSSVALFQLETLTQSVVDDYAENPNLDAYNAVSTNVKRLSSVGSNFPVQDVIYIPNDMSGKPKKVRASVWWPASVTPYEGKIVEFLPGMDYEQPAFRSDAIPQNFWYDDVTDKFDETSRKYIKRIYEDVLDRKQTVMNNPIVSNDLTLVSYNPPLTNLDSNFKVLYQGTLNYPKESNTYFDTSEHLIIGYSPEVKPNPDYIFDQKELFVQWYIDNYEDRLYDGTLASADDFKYWIVPESDFFNQTGYAPAGRDNPNLLPGQTVDPLNTIEEDDLNPSITIRELDSIYLYNDWNQVSNNRANFLNMLQDLNVVDPVGAVNTNGEPEYWRIVILSGDAPNGVYDAQYDLTLEQNQPSDEDERYDIFLEFGHTVSWRTKPGQAGSFWIADAGNKMTPIAVTVESRDLEEGVNYEDEFVNDEFNRSLNRVEIGDYLLLAFQDKYVRDVEADEWYFGFGQFGEHKANTLNMTTMDRGVSEYDPTSGLIQEVASLKIKGIVNPDPDFLTPETLILQVEKDEVLRIKEKYKRNYDIFNPPTEFMSSENSGDLVSKMPFATIVKGNGLKSILVKTPSSNNSFIPVSDDFNYRGAISRDNLVLFKNMYSDTLYFGPSHQDTPWRKKGFRFSDISSRSSIWVSEYTTGNVTEVSISIPEFQTIGGQATEQIFNEQAANLNGAEVNEDQGIELYSAIPVKWRNEFVNINKDAYRVGDVGVRETSGISKGSIGFGFGGTYFDPSSEGTNAFLEGQGIFLEPGANNFSANTDLLDLDANTFIFSFDVSDFQAIANSYPIADTSNLEYISSAIDWAKFESTEPRKLFATGRVTLREQFILQPGANTQSTSPWVRETEKYIPYPIDEYPIATVNTNPTDVNSQGIVIALVYQDKSVEDGSKLAHCQGVVGYKPQTGYPRLTTELLMESVFNIESGMAVQFEGYIPDNTYVTFVDYDTNIITISQPTLRDIIKNHILTFAPDHNENYEICTVPLNTAPPFEGTNTGLITATSHPILQVNDLVIENLSLLNQETVTLVDDIQNEKLELQYIEANTIAYEIRTFDMFFKGPTRPYILSSSVPAVSEGVPFTITLRTTEEEAGAEVAYAITGISEEDINATASNTVTGAFVIQDGGASSNTAELTFKLAADKLTDPDENFILTLTEHSDVSISIPVTDTSKTPPPPDPIYNLSSNKFASDEGEVIEFTLRTSNLAEGATVPYTISGVEQSDLATGSVTGVFTLDAEGNGTVELSLAEDAETEGQETLTLTIDNSFVSVSVLIQDTSTGPDYTFQVVNNGAVAYNLVGEDNTGNIFGNNPSLDFTVGQIVEFNINSPGHPFYLKTANTTGTANQVLFGVTGQGSQTGTVTWKIEEAGTYYYKCSIHAAMGGVINVSD